MGIPPEVTVPLDLLQASPFTTYLIPGLLLSPVIGGLHLAGFILLINHHRQAPLAAAAAGVVSPSEPELVERVVTALDGVAAQHVLLVIGPATGQLTRIEVIPLETARLSQ